MITQGEKNTMSVSGTELTRGAEMTPAESVVDFDAFQERVNDLWGEIQGVIQRQRLPVATYRVQLHQRFTLAQAKELVPYLVDLGVTDLYSSPLLMAAPGSNHGYDVVAHDRINPEIGTEDDLVDLSNSLRSHGMGLVLDIVPNHMSVSSGANGWWNDVLENGPSSRYANYFDIDWMPLKPDLANKVLLPVLGDQFGKVLEEGGMRLAYEEGAFFLHVYETRYPIAPRSYVMILGHRLEVLRGALDENSPELLEYLSILTAIGNLPLNSETADARLEERRREKEVVKRRLRELVERSPTVAAFLETNLKEINGEPADPHSYDLLDRILQQQAYRLAYWRVAADEINYRRFFDINSLAAICVENADVFEGTHALVLDWLERGLVNGLRIDHPDGLFDPAGYLKQLQQRRFEQICRRAISESDVRSEEERGQLLEVLRARWGEEGQGLKSSVGRPLYVVVEKILEHGEPFPADWSVHGTVGYEVLNGLNGVFVDPRGEKELSATYARFTGYGNDFDELAYACKRLNVRHSMGSELNVLAHRLDRISEQNRWTRDFTLNSLTRSLQELIACFGIYRTYVQTDKVSARDRRFVQLAVKNVKNRHPEMSESVFDFIRETLLLEGRANANDEERRAIQLFVGKFQQLTGPIMAKAIEDTAFYRYGRLISLNEVGGAPDHFGNSVQEFHAMNRRRVPAFDHGMSSTSTHDTKRSEDVRARINVLSEVPGEWSKGASRWSRRNQSLKGNVEGTFVPSRNDEYLIYQTLIGIWPEGGITPEVVERLKEYLLKAGREAKIHTSWINPNEAYEKGVAEFVEQILEAKQRRSFLKDLEGFALKVRRHGRWNSVAQVVLKIASPGVPDLFQGMEIESLTLVDPDNRRPVDYERCARVLQEVNGLSEQLTAAETAGLFEERGFDRLKMLVTRRALHARRERPELFTAGEYVPLAVRGTHAESVVAFARKSGEQVAIVVVPRLTVRVTGFGEGVPVGEVWGETEVVLGEEFQGRVFKDVLSGREWTVRGEGVAVRDLLLRLPVSLSVCSEGGS